MTAELVEWINGGWWTSLMSQLKDAPGLLLLLLGTRACRVLYSIRVDHLAIHGKSKTVRRQAMKIVQSRKK